MQVLQGSLRVLGHISTLSSRILSHSNFVHGMSINEGGHRFSNDWYGLFDEKSVTSEIHRTHRQAHHSVDSKDFQKSDKSKVIDESGINDTAESDEENGKKITHILKKKKRKPRKKFDKAGKVENIDTPGNLAVSARQPGIEGNIRRDIREKITGAIAAVSGQDKKVSIAAVSGQDKKGSIAAVSGKGSIAAVSDEDKKGSIAAVSGQDKKGSVAAVSGQDKKGSVAAVSGQDKKGSIAALKSIMINRELAGGLIVDN